MIGRLEWMLLEMRRRISRSEWMVRRLGLSKSEGTEAKPGLILIQIDGLSKRQLEHALAQGNMPFLKSLIRQEGYRLHTLYSGLPSNTPGFQGEFFYGIKGVVPGFGYRRGENGRIMILYDPKAAASIQEAVSSTGDAPLLEGGSAYSDFFSGGALESHFCPATIGWNSMLRAANPLTVGILAAWHGWSVVRVATLLLLEFGLALADCVRGLIAGEDLWKELKFVPTRVAISILLRELVTIGATIDAVRGLPVVHLNYLGYDEQAHRRGPSSAFAHWTLKGIDDGIKRVWHAARRSSRRDYDVWIYSDHGQEETVSYETEHGRSIHDAVAAVMSEYGRSAAREDQEGGGIQLMRASWLGGRLARWLLRGKGPAGPDDPPHPVVTALGPVGHIYCDQAVEPRERDRLAGMLVKQAGIPLVLVPDEPDTARAWSDAGEFRLPDDAKEVLGADHPFLEEAAQDLVALCHHPDSGLFIISGWRTDGMPLSFPIENGAHAGPGREETRAFALLPGTAPVSDPGGSCLRALDLRDGALRHLERSSMPAPPLAARRPGDRKALRIMTYNVHSCRGMDGKLSPDRIARVIAHYDPDIVALQELDVGRSRTGEVDQAKVIAQMLKMEYHFHPALTIEEEQYGDAVLSRRPMRRVKAEGLPVLASAPYLEPRGALWVSITVDGCEFQLINTHLGLSRRERLLQAEALLGADWLGHPNCRAPVIVCGDFNAQPGSVVFRMFDRRLQDAQRALMHHRPKGTWFGRYPFHRIDHVFVDREIAVRSIEVPRTTLTRLASDHLPLIVDVALP